MRSAGVKSNPLAPTGSNAASRLRRFKKLQFEPGCLKNFVSSLRLRGSFGRGSGVRLGVWLKTRVTATPPSETRISYLRLVSSSVCAKVKLVRENGRQFCLKTRSYSLIGGRSGIFANNPFISITTDAYFGSLGKIFQLMRIVLDRVEHIARLSVVPFHVMPF